MHPILIYRFPNCLNCVRCNFNSPLLLLALLATTLLSCYCDTSDCTNSSPCVIYYVDGKNGHDLLQNRSLQDIEITSISGEAPTFIELIEQQSRKALSISVRANSTFAVKLLPYQADTITIGPSVKIKSGCCSGEYIPDSVLVNNKEMYLIYKIELKK